MKKLWFSLLACGLMILLGLSLFAGVTFAWVAQRGEPDTPTVKMGSFDLLLSAYDENGDTIPGFTGFGPLFSSPLTPGASVTRFIKVENVGTIKLKVALDVVFSGSSSAGVNGVPDLCDVLEYEITPIVPDYVNDGTGVWSVDKDALTKAISFVPSSGAWPTTSTGSISLGYYLLVGEDWAKDGNPHEVVFRIDFKIRDSVGSFYDGKPLSANFELSLLQAIATTGTIVPWPTTP
ncbi:MAG: hypothetical protein FWE59_04140 [Oscillospiraceae bacterium]|nr:hypothetical protein [Oscillospiraceae bacterium]